MSCINAVTSAMRPNWSYLARVSASMASPVCCRISRGRPTIARAAGTISFSALAPRLPPTTNTRRGEPGVQALSLRSSASEDISRRSGLPQAIAPIPAAKLPGKASSTTVAHRASQRLVVPGILFCSCSINGTPRPLATSPPGPETNPPMPSTTCGLTRRRMANDWRNARTSMKGALRRPSQPLPRIPVTDSHSTGIPAAGTTLASSPLRVPIQTTSWPASRNSRATASAG